jgi:CheY-like chemotaxis protein
MSRKRSMIVIVEDDLPTLELLCELLSDEGYQTVCCRTVNDAHDRIRQDQPDVVILDLHMAGSDSGLSLLDILRKTPATLELPVVVCSADTKLLKHKAQELASANCAVLEKPFDIDEFVDTVRTMSSQLWRAQQPKAYHACAAYDE